MKRRIIYCLTIAIAAAIMLPALTMSAYAACVNPAGAPGHVFYNNALDVFQSCTENNGWMALHGATGAVASVQRVQHAVSGTSSNPETASFASTPSEGNLLVVIAGHRHDSSGTNTISGSGWTEHILINGYSGTSSARRGLAVWSKTAGPGEPTDIEVKFGSSSGNPRILIQEFQINNASFSFDTKAEMMGTDSVETSISTGTTDASATDFSLVITALVTRNSVSAPPSWTNGIGNRVGAPGLVSLDSGYALDKTQSAKESTASWTTTEDTMAAAGILVFTITPDL